MEREIFYFFLRNQTNRPFCGFENPISGLENPILGARSAPQRLVSISRILGLHFGKSGGFFYFFTFYFPEKNFPRFARFFLPSWQLEKFCVSARGKVAFPLGEKVSNFSWQKFQLSFLGISWNFSWQKSQLFCGIKQTGPFAARKPYFGIPKNANAWEVQLARFLWPVGGRPNKRNQTNRETFHQ